MRAFRIQGLLKKVVIHQTVYMLMALVDNFVYPLAYAYILDEGLVKKESRVTFMIGLAMMTWTMLRYHIKLNYFHGSMLVMQHLRAALLRKYLTLGAIDHARNPDVRYEFESAIRHNVDEVSPSFLSLSFSPSLHDRHSTARFHS